MNQNPRSSGGSGKRQICKLSVTAPRGQGDEQGPETHRGGGGGVQNPSVLSTPPGTLLLSTPWGTGGLILSQGALAFRLSLVIQCAAATGRHCCQH